MNLKLFKLFIFILYLLSPTLTYSIEHPNIKNLIIYKEPKKLENIVFKNYKGEIIKLSEFRNKLVVLNFWATWCLPCREEMPSLDQLASNEIFKNISVIPINIGRESQSKSENFFNEINIKNLNIYYDSSIDIPNKLSLRGIPTTYIFEYVPILGKVGLITLGTTLMLFIIGYGSFFKKLNNLNFIFLERKNSFYSNLYFLNLFISNAIIYFSLTEFYGSLMQVNPGYIFNLELVEFFLYSLFLIDTVDKLKLVKKFKNDY